MSGPAPAQTAEQLLAAMLNKPFYVAIRHPLDLTRMGELLEAHLRWAIAAEKRGELFASGPFVADGVPPGQVGGMTILRAGSLTEAKDILAQDPFIREGVFSVELRAWRLMEGEFTVNVRFSDQRSRLL
ncbi:YciI family protein [Aquabacterium sp. J223]|uniref:YciI family protein n=1 Tax=Aquabacterium sp. J223 TaxID=2898431 RepID=UPI0021AD69E9|nr:YciI family protein [Aquabacterium sp. J223]UUX95348.1 YciI family protein [Aquabacterium sp. J223]